MSESIDFSALRPEACRIFLSLFDTGYVSITSRHLQKDKRSIRHSLYQMRASFKDEIFTSSPVHKGKLTPTSLAISLYPTVKSLLDAYHGVENIVSQSSLDISDKNIRIAYVPMFSLAFPRFAHSLHKFDRSVAVTHETITKGNRQDCQKRLQASEFDCLIDFTSETDGAENFRRTQLISDDFMLVFSPDFEPDDPIELIMEEGVYVSTGIDAVDQYVESLGGITLVRGILTDADMNRMVYNGPYFSVTPRHICSRWDERVAGRPNVHLRTFDDFPLKYEVSAFFRHVTDDRKSLLIRDSLRAAVEVFQ